MGNQQNNFVIHQYCKALTANNILNVLFPKEMHKIESTFYDLSRKTSEVGTDDGNINTFFKAVSFAINNKNYGVLAFSGFNGSFGNKIYFPPTAHLINKDIIAMLEATQDLEEKPLFKDIRQTIANGLAYCNTERDMDALFPEYVKKSCVPKTLSFVGNTHLQKVSRDSEFSLDKVTPAMKEMFEMKNEKRLLAFKKLATEKLLLGE